MADGRASAFFGYLKEREEVRLRKEADLIALENFEDPQGPPWTEDKILQTYKFTNVRRHHDRTSTVLREKFYTPHFDDDRCAILMNAALFRYFGTYEFAEAVGWQDYATFDFEGIKDLAKERLANRERVFTGAYVITNQGISAPKQEVVVDYFLKGLYERTPSLIETVARTGSWKQVSSQMRGIIGFGGTGFMTKEILLDTTYTSFWDNTGKNNDGQFSYPVDWWEWTPIGPGALRGASRILDEDADPAKPVNEAKARDVLMWLYYGQEEYWPANFGKLSPTDIQFGLCEFDKYERVRLGQGKPRSKYRPKK